MLSQLFIQNIAVIEKVQVAFEKGLNVFTGETGAGKSIVIDAKGNVVAKAKDEEQILYADIDLSDSVKIRKDRPYTDLRRTEFYR